jgi:hypothetical protein
MGNGHAARGIVDSHERLVGPDGNGHVDVTVASCYTVIKHEAWASLRRQVPLFAVKGK